MEASIKGYTKVLRAEVLRHLLLMGGTWWGGCVSHDQPVYPKNAVNMSECNRICRHSHIFFWIFLIALMLAQSF